MRRSVPPEPNSRPPGVRVFAAAIALGAALLSSRAAALDNNTQAAGSETASARDPDVRVAQARAYEHGEGVAKDQIKAALIYCEAARDGDPEAQFSLGWMYANGRGVARDDSVASSLFELAAANGHEQAGRTQALIKAGPAPLPECMRPDLPDVSSMPAAQFDIALDDPDPFANLPPWKQKIAKVVVELAPKYAVDPRLALAFIAVESNFETTAQSPKDARGLMQLIPETVTRFNVRNVYDVKDNVHGGLAYLRWLLAYYRGQVRLAAAAYNAGEKVVDRYGGVPPYTETIDYVRRIQKLFRRDTHPYDPDAVQPSPIFSLQRTVGGLR
jgi:TPR repeat protein